MKVGLSAGYWGSGPPPNAKQRIAEAEALGVDSFWTAETYGSDALTPLAWSGSRNSHMALGTSVCQMSAADGVVDAPAVDVPVRRSPPAGCGKCSMCPKLIVPLQIDLGVEVRR